MVTKIEGRAVTSIGEDRENLGPIHTAGGNVGATATLGNSVAICS